MNTNSVFLDLVQNAALLLALALVFDITMRHWKMETISWRQVLIGLTIGGIGITLMMTPWQFTGGIIFDTRSVLLSISGLFFGFIPTVIAVLMTAAFRIYQGGMAAGMGVSVIAATALLGLLWRYLRKGELAAVRFRELYLLGLIAHVIMLALTFVLPWDTAINVLKSISLPVLLIYPAATALLGELMAGRMRQQQVNLDLQESEERLRLAVEAANIGFFERNFQTQAAHFSTKWKQQLGYADNEIQDDSSEWQNRVHPEDMDSVLEKIDACTTGKTPRYEAEYRLRHKDGSYRWILARGEVQQDPHGKPLRLLGSHIDITTLQQTKEALEKSKEQYRVLTENIKDVVWVLDAETFYFRYVSPSVERLRGYSVEEILAVPVDHALMPEAGDALKDLIRQRAKAFLSGQLASDEYFINEVEQPCKDGSTVRTEVITNYYANPETGRVEVLGVTRDITERHEARENIRHLNEELEQRVRERTAQLEAANQELEAFAYSVSHDLRAPLRAMDGFSAALREEYQEKLDEQGQHYINRIRGAASRMSDLINDLLNLSRVTRSELIPRRVDLSQLAENVATNMQSENMDRKIQVEIDPGMMVNADPRLMQIVVENLLSNAFKFTITKETSLIRVGMVNQNGASAYFVRDNGVGFDMAYAENLFAPFQRLHSVREFPGTGIGLVTVKRIIVRHGGRVWVEAEPDAGAAFYFTLGEK